MSHRKPGGGSLSRVALLTHSTTPRGGHVHTLGLGEALHRAGQPVHLVALGERLYRPVELPHTVVPGPAREGTTLEQRVFASIENMAAALAARIDEFDVLHAQDCIAASAALRARALTGSPVRVLRTAHHVDDFTTQALIDCQRRAIVEPDRVLVVSEQWRRILRSDFGVETTVVPNAVDTARFAHRIVPARGARAVLLAVGGIEPRKGTVVALRALARLDPRPVLVIVGGHSFQDFAPYRDAALAELPALGLTLGVDVVEVGTVTDAELAGWYAGSDVLCYPSIAEGFGLVAIEAMSQGLPVVASDIEVFGEYLTDGEDALLPAAGDPDALATALHRVLHDAALRDRLRGAGAATARSYTWAAAATAHATIYADLGR